MPWLHARKGREASETPTVLTSLVQNHRSWRGREGSLLWDRKQEILTLTNNLTQQGEREYHSSPSRRCLALTDPESGGSHSMGEAMWTVHGFTTLSPVACLSFPVSYTSSPFLYITSPACFHWLFGFLRTNLRVLVPVFPYSHPSLV